MTARPGQIKEDVAVGLPRPRDVTSQEFNILRRRITGLVEEEARKAFAAGGTAG